MMEVYQHNHKPKFAYLEPIQEFKHREDLPNELYNLDILDGSPPCSTFSMMGSREKAWGKMKHFREGQAKQVLDTLFFDFIDLAKKLQPKIVIAENVKGLLLGGAKKYVTKIYEEFDKAGYYCTHFLLDAQNMGVPQRRERVLFVCLRKDLAELVPMRKNLFEQEPYINLDFNEPMIPFGEIADYSGRKIESPILRMVWDNRKEGDLDFGDVNTRVRGKDTSFGKKFIYNEKVCPTLLGKEDCLISFEQPRYLGRSEICCISSFPQDYDFLKQKPHYVCGMSVPPIMMAQISSRIYEQWLIPINEANQ